MDRQSLAHPRLLQSQDCGIDIHWLRQFCDDASWYQNTSECYIKAYTIITDKHRRAMIVGALSSHLSDAVLCEVLADNRVPLNLSTIDAELRAEMEYFVGVKSKT